MMNPLCLKNSFFVRQGQAARCLLGTLLFTVLPGWATFGQNKLIADEREFGATAQIGLCSPARFVPNSEQAPIGVELSYNRLFFRQQGTEICRQFARAGVLLQGYTFRNSAVLGHSLGAALFYEPLLVQLGRFQVSGRILAGVSYVSHHFDKQTNPTNTAIGTTVNGLIGTGINVRYRLTPAWRLLVGFDAKHLSNAGIRLPNQGLNTPALAVGLTHYTGGQLALTKRKCPPMPLSQKWLARVVGLASTRVLPATADRPEHGYPIWGLNLIGGHAVWRSHFLSGGVELLDDRSFREQIRRYARQVPPHQQVTLLAGYEYWMGPFALTAHMGWNVVRPLDYKPATYQKYGLLARSRRGLTGGISVKAYGDDTKNIQLIAGYSF